MDNAPTINDVFKSLITEKDVQKFISVVKSVDQVDCPVYHHFTPGLYIREINVPANTVLIGYKQKTEHSNIFLKGRVLVVSDGVLNELVAPMVFTGKPGRKIGLVKEDMVWLNVYPTNETDIGILEDTYLDKTEQWTEKELKDIGKIQDRTKDQDDYHQFLTEANLTDKQIKQATEFDQDMIPFPPGTYAVRTHPSLIEGIGLFATANFGADEYIAPAVVGIYRTPAGRYANHSGTPNAKVMVVGNDTHLVAIKDIRGCQGGIIGDEITIDYRESLKIPI